MRELLVVVFLLAAVGKCRTQDTEEEPSSIPFEITITPKHVQINESATNVTVNCSVPLHSYQACQFTFFDFWNKSYVGPILDFTNFLRTETWNDSHVNQSLLTPHLIGYQYAGEYYGPLTCGVTLNLAAGQKLWVVGCRLKSYFGTWYYEHMTIHAHALNNIDLPLSSVPNEVIALPGKDASLDIKAQEPLNSCWFLPPGVERHFYPIEGQRKGGKAKYSVPPFIPGSGIAQGECDASLGNMTEEQNGWFLGFVGHQVEPGENIETRIVPVVVAHPPSAPVLEITSDDLRLDSILEATCVVNGGRPVANITWYIGDRLIRQDAVDESRDLQWRWPTTRQKVTQQLTRRLKKEDHAQNLRCVATHIALAQPLESKRHILVRNVSPLRMTVTPDHLHIGRYETNVTIVCQASVPLRKCQFKWWRTWPSEGDGLFFDLSLGPQSEVNSSYLDPDIPGRGWHNLQGYSYSGTGLQYGQCGITMNLGDGGTKDWVVGCRGQDEKRGWHHGVMSLYADGKKGFNSTLSPREPVVVPGGTVSILIQTEKPLLACSYRLHDTPDTKNRFTFADGHQSERGDTYRYFGASLPAGECGIVLSNVTEEMNGWMHSTVASRLGDWETRVIPFVVAHRPDNPVLKVLSTNFSEGALLEATCVVTNSRPLANVSWYLGSQVLRQDDIDDRPGELEWRRPIDLLNITQRLFYTLEAGDNGKALRCVVNHVTLGEPLEDKRVISFEDCGKRNSKHGQALIDGGVESEVREFPWHVAVYNVGKTGHSLVCGGSLITTRLVISAAHCFWSNVYNKKNDASQYKLAAGKHVRSWDDDDPLVQRRDAAKIIVHERYAGRRTNLQYDIALVKVDVAFELNPAVNLICIDWRDERESEQMVPGNNGSVVGWGHMGGKGLSDVLNIVHLPYIPFGTCLSALHRDAAGLFTLDKFCAGYVNRNTSACPGDSGGGLVFQDPKTGRYDLRGIVSASFRPPSFQGKCYSQLYSAFTNVSSYRSWIEGNNV